MTPLQSEIEDLQASKLPREKTLESFDLKRLPVKAARQVKVLQDGSFLDRKRTC